MTLAAVVLCLQPVLAGEFLSGTDSALHAHERVADIASATLLLATICAGLLRFVGRGPMWPLPTTALLLILTGAEIGFGKERMLAVHVPLAVAIVGTSVWLAIWSWRGLEEGKQA